MSIETILTNLGAKMAELGAKVDNLAEVMQAAAGAAPAPKKRGRPAKEKADGAGEDAAAPAPKKRGRPAKAKGKAVTKTELIKVAADWLKEAQGDADLIAKRRDTIKAIAAEWEAERLSELPKEAWGPVMTAIKEAIEAESAGGDEGTDEDDLF